MTDVEKTRDVGVVTPEDIKDGIAYAHFGSVVLNEHPIDEATGHRVDVLVPIPVHALEAAGVDVDNPDPYDGSVGFWADVATPVDRIEDAEPTNFEPIDHMTREDIAAWEGRN